MTRATPKPLLQPWDVADEVRTVADAVRIGRESAQMMIATAARLAIGDRAQDAGPEDVPMDIALEVHLFTVEAVSELSTGEVPRAIERTESSAPEKKKD